MFFARSYVWGVLAAYGLFALHRTMVLRPLGLRFLQDREARIFAVTGGFFGDLWFACLWELCALLVYGGLAKRFERASRAIHAILILLLALLLGMHVRYVSFFRSLINPFHLQYLFNRDFAAASFGELWDARLLFVAACGIVLALATHHLSKSSPLQHHRRRLLAVVLGLFVLGGLGQAYKVQVLFNGALGKKVPTTLVFNIFEFLIAESLENKPVPRLLDADIDIVAHMRGVSFDVALERESAQKNLLEEGMLPAESVFGLSLKRVIAANRSAKKPVRIIVALLESMLPANSKFFTPTLDRTLMPGIDDLARRSVTYDNLFTAGSVTRGGQEAVFCGLLTGIFTSAMKTLQNLDPLCLPGVFKRSLPRGSYRTGFWHGGESNYDSQGAFWHRIGMDRVLTRSEFPSDAPRIFWGVSDILLMEKFTNNLIGLGEPLPVEAHLILTVVNHSDWGLPPDSQQTLEKEMKDVTHPSFITTRYTDVAVTHLVELLKDGGQWQDSVLFITNDHGNLLPTMANAEGGSWGTSAAKDLEAARMASHGFLVVTGGLVERALQESSTKPYVDHRLVSQVDIFSTIVDLLDTRAPTVGDSLFARQRRFPVISDLGDFIFSPSVSGEPDLLVKRRDLMENPAGTTPNDPNLRDRVGAFMRLYGNLLISGRAGDE